MVDDTILSSELNGDFDNVLLPLVPADYIDRPQSSPAAIDVRLFNDIADEETELLDEDLLDLIAAGPELTVQHARHRTPQREPTSRWGVSIRSLAFPYVIFLGPPCTPTCNLAAQEAPERPLTHVLLTGPLHRSQA